MAEKLISLLDYRLNNNLDMINGGSEIGALPAKMPTVGKATAPGSLAAAGSKPVNMTAAAVVAGSKLSSSQASPLKSPAAGGKPSPGLVAGAKPSPGAGSKASPGSGKPSPGGSQQGAASKPLLPFSVTPPKPSGGRSCHWNRRAIEYRREGGEERGIIPRPPPPSLF